MGQPNPSLGIIETQPTAQGGVIFWEGNMFNTSKWFKKFVMVTGFVAMGASVGNIALAAPADDVIFDMSQKVLKDLKSL